MSSVCISNCVKDALDPRAPVRATYVNLYRWPESDEAEFIKAVRRVAQGIHDNRPRVVDSMYCRQVYLRSYTFSRKESVGERTKKCFGKVKEKVANRITTGDNKRSDHKGSKGSPRNNKCFVLMKKALIRIFNRFLFCSATVDVADPRPN